MSEKREYRLDDGRLLQWIDGRLIIRNDKGQIEENLLPSALASQQASGSRKADQDLVHAILQEVGKEGSPTFRALAERVARGKDTRAIIELIQFAKLDQKAPGQPVDMPAVGESCPTCKRIMEDPKKTVISREVIAKVLARMEAAAQS